MKLLEGEQPPTTVRIVGGPMEGIVLEPTKTELKLGKMVVVSPNPVEYNSSPSIVLEIVRDKVDPSEWVVVWPQKGGSPYGGLWEFKLSKSAYNAVFKTY